MSDTPTMSLGDVVRNAQAAGANVAVVAPTLPPMPAAAPPPPAPALALIPELAAWVEQCKAAGHDTRSEAASGMVQRGLWTQAQADAFVGSAMQPVGFGAVKGESEPVVVPVTAEVVSTTVTPTETTVVVSATAHTTPPAEPPTSAPARRGRKAKGSAAATETEPAPAQDSDSESVHFDRPISIGYDHGLSSRAEVLVECVKAGHTPEVAAKYLALLGGAS